MCLAIVPFSHYTCKHGSAQAWYPRLCTAAQTGHRGLLLLGVVSFQLYITIVTPGKTVICVFAGEKRMLQDHREVQDPWVDLPLPRFLSLK